MFRLLIAIGWLFVVGGAPWPPELRSLDAIHLATASRLADWLSQVCTYDERMGTAAELLGFSVVAPA